MSYSVRLSIAENVQCSLVAPESKMFFHVPGCKNQIQQLFTVLSLIQRVFVYCMLPPPPHLGRGGTVYGEGKALTDYQVAINLLGSTVLCNYHLSFWLPPKTNILWVDLEVNLIEVQTKGVRIRSEFHSDRISLFYCRIGFCRFFVGSDLGFSCIASNYSNILTN